MSEFFLPELSVVAYATLSVLMCLAVYRASLVTFAWGVPSMSQPAGGGWIRQVDADDSPAQAAATSGINVMNSMTPGGMASIVVFLVWLVFAYLGVTVGPAIFGAMSRPSTANVLLVGIAGLCIAFAMARLTLTLIGLVLGMAMMVIVLGAIAAIVLYLANFLWGGSLQIIDTLAAWRKGVSVEESVGLGPDGTMRKRAAFNWCVMQTAISTVGDMRATRSRCDRNWIDPKSQASYERNAEREKLLRSAPSSNIELRDWALRNAHGFPTKDMPIKNRSLAGNWVGRLVCGDQHYRVWMTTQGNERSAKGVMHVFRAIQGEVFNEPGMPRTASTYRIEIEKEGNTVSVRAGERLLAGEGTPAIEGTFEYTLLNFPQLSNPSTRPRCRGYVEGIVDKQA